MEKLNGNKISQFKLSAQVSVLVIMTSTKDDWKIDVERGKNHPVPTFVRLFVINRTLYQLCKIHKTKKMHFYC